MQAAHCTAQEITCEAEGDIELPPPEESQASSFTIQFKAFQGFP
jgi:hypothetical protein